MEPGTPDNVDMTDGEAVFELAKEHHERGEFEAAMRYYLMSADLGHPNAFNNIPMRSTTSDTCTPQERAWSSPIP